MKQLIKFPIIALICAIVLIPTAASAQPSLQSAADDINKVISALNDNLDSITTSLDSISAQQVVIGNKDNEQWLELEKVRLHHNEEMMEYYVGIVAIIVGCAMLILICVLPIFFICYFIYRKRIWRYRVLEKAIENKVDLSDKLLENLETAPSEKQNKSSLESAAMWIACGVGIMLFNIFCDNYALAGLCIIPILVGVAKLATYFIERNNRSNKNNDNNDVKPI